MSQAEELLNTLSEDSVSTYTTDSTTEPHITIGANRVISVPAELKRIAVQFDHNIETVTFDCPRYWDEHDMSTMAIYINYLTPDNAQGSYIATDVSIDETDPSIMHFKWTITRNVTQKKGTLSFLVCIRKTDTEGNETNHWNSELNREMTISEGLECDETILEQHPDIVTQLLLILANPPKDGYTPVKGVDYYTDADKTEMVGEVLDRIPKATALHMKRSGNTITVTSSLVGAETSTSIITLNENDRPSTIVTDGVECTVTWEGFDT